MSSHTITYQIPKTHNTGGVELLRDVKVHATEEELDHLDQQGYLVRERLFQGEHLEQLRDATERLFDAEVDLAKRKTSKRS